MIPPFMCDCEVDFQMGLDSLVVTVVLLIRGTISNNWRLIVEVEPKKTLELVFIECNTYILLDGLVCSIVGYFYESRRILASP